jgi:hypothetical protein
MTHQETARPRSSGAAHDALFVIWVALIAADRIDLLGGVGAFSLTPYIVLTPFVLASELLRRHLRQHPIRITSQASAFLLVVFALLGVVGISVFVSPETTKSASRAALLMVHVLGALSVVLAASDRGELDRLFERGAVAGLFLFAVFDVLELASVFGAVPETWHAGPLFLNLEPALYADFFPQLSGTVADQNRAGLLLVFYGWFVGYRPGRGPRTGLLAMTFVLGLCTLSRSATLAGLAVVAVLILERRIRTISARFLLALSVTAAFATFVLLASPAARTWASTALEPFAERVSVDRGSAQQHVLLIERGIDEATASLPRMVVGLGYGSAYTVLQDIYPGHRYSNFHSLYVTFFAESGLVALLCVLLLFAVPLVRGGRYRALLAGAALFNVFYQAHAEPQFWVILTLAWLTLPAFRIAAARRATVRRASG